MNTIRTGLVWTVLLMLVLTGCPEEQPEETVTPVVRLAPRSGGLGMVVEIELRGTNTEWEEGLPTVDLGDGITVRNMVAEGRTLAYAEAEIAPDATLGKRDVRITTGDHELTIPDGFIVQTGGISIEPARARLGESLDVSVTGYNTTFQDGYTQASFGDGIWVDTVEVLTESSAIVRISIDPTAAPGHRDVTMFNGSTAWTLFDGFLVDRSALTIHFEPPSGFQGDEVDFTIKGTDTAFVDGATILDMGDDIPVDFISVIDASNAFGRMTIGNAATVGLRDVVVQTHDEILIVHDGFEVFEVPPDVDNTMVTIRYTVSRSKDNNSCQNDIGYSAYILFWEPLDPPCGESPPPTMVFPFDINYNYPVWTGGDVDCPFPNTFDAGDHVYMDSNDGTHSLVFDRETDPYSGVTAYYLDHAVTPDTYNFDRHYSLRAPGSSDPLGIPPFDTREDETPGADPGGVVMHTIPINYEVTAPELCNNFTHDPNEPLTVDWTMAMTYDVAGLSMVLQIQDADTTDGDDSAYNIVLPWDDGSWTFESEMLTMLPEGNGYLIFGDYAKQPTFQLPFSDIMPSGPPASSGFQDLGFIILSSAGEPE